MRRSHLVYSTVNDLPSLNLADKQIAVRIVSANCRDSVFAFSGINEKTAIWDVTTTYAPLKVDFLTDNASAQFRQTENGKREYVAFNTAASFPTPSLVGNVSNQDIHAMTPPTMPIHILRRLVRPASLPSSRKPYTSSVLKLLLSLVMSADSQVSSVG